MIVSVPRSVEVTPAGCGDFVDQRHSVDALRGEHDAPIVQCLRDNHRRLSGVEHLLVDARSLLAGDRISAWSIVWGELKLEIPPEGMWKGAPASLHVDVPFVEGQIE